MKHNTVTWAKGAMRTRTMVRSKGYTQNPPYKGPKHTCERDMRLAQDLHDAHDRFLTALSNS